MLNGVDSIDWGSLNHAYGEASDVPEILRSLLSPEAAENAAYELYGNIWHQGTVYSATAAAVPFLYEILAAPGVKGRSGIAHLLASIAAGRGYLEVHAVSPHGEKSWREILGKRGKSLEEEISREAAVTASVHRAASSGLPALIPFLKDDEPEIRRAVASALGEYPEHTALSTPALTAAAEREVDEEAREAIQEAIDRLTSRCSGPGHACDS
jgi:HEAT repeat protein